MGKLMKEGKAGTTKKWKGKKKVKNLLEKKKKGLHLGQVDRRKLVKLEQKKELNERLEESIRENMERLEERSSSSLSESSFGSQPIKKAPSRRVSFAEALEHRKLFDKNDKKIEVKASTASPGKSILKEKKQKKAGKKKKAKSPSNAEEEMEVDENEPAEEKKEKSKAAAITKVDAGVTKKKPTLVPKSLKEKLLALPRKERKALLLEYKAKKKPHMERAAKCKLLWEKMRSGKTPAAEKEKAISELCGLIKGHARLLIYAHDTVRVIECLLALNRKDINDQLFTELAPEIVRMAKSKYSRFFVTKMLKYGSVHQRQQVIEAFRGHCVSLFRIVWAAEILLETAYNDYANAQQRFDIISEFYGKEFVLFRTDKIRSLKQILEEEPGKKKLIVKHLEEIVLDVVQKTTLRHSLTHRLLLDCFSHCDKEQKSNLIDSLKDKLPELVHTNEGSQVAMRVVWNANAKERKLIIKNFKGLSVKAAMEQHGCRVLMSIFDSVDDTVLVNKYITQELANEIKKVVMDKFGVRVIHYLVHPRDGRVLDQDIIKQVKMGDGNDFSKKPASERYSELFACISKPLFTFMAANMDCLLRESVETSNLVLDSLEAPGPRELFVRSVDAEDRSACYSALAELASREFVPCDVGQEHLIEHKQGSFVLGRLLRCDDAFPEDLRLSSHLAALDSEQIGSWVGCNKGCFILLRLMEKGSESTREKVASSVSIRRLESYTTKGAELLLAALRQR